MDRNARHLEAAAALEASAARRALGEDGLAAATTAIAAAVSSAGRAGESVAVGELIYEVADVTWPVAPAAEPALRRCSCVKRRALLVARRDKPNVAWALNDPRESIVVAGREYRPVGERVGRTRGRIRYDIFLTQRHAQEWLARDLIDVIAGFAARAESDGEWLRETVRQSAEVAATIGADGNRAEYQLPPELD